MQERFRTFAIYCYSVHRGDHFILKLQTWTNISLFSQKSDMVFKSRDIYAN